MGTVFHETDFNRIASRVFKTDLSYFLAYKANRLVGVMPCHTFKSRLTRHSFSNLSSFEIPYGGWVFNSHMVLIDELLIKTHLRVNESLAIVSNLDIETAQNSSCGSKNIVVLNTVVINLDETRIEELWNTFASKLRRRIRHATKLGIEVELLPPEDFDQFFNIFQDLKDRVGLKMRDKDFYRGVFSHYHNLGKAACLTAIHKGEPISSIIILANKNYTIAWVAGRRSGLPNNLYQNELLIWEALRWASEYGSKYFDLCGLDKERLPHLARIKLSFSKDIRNFYFYLKRSPAYPFLRRAQRLLNRRINE